MFNYQRVGVDEVVWIYPCAPKLSWDYLRKVIDYFLLQLKGIVNTSFYWNLSDLYIDFAVIFLSLAWTSWNFSNPEMFSLLPGASCNTRWQTSWSYEPFEGPFASPSFKSPSFNLRVHTHSFTLMSLITMIAFSIMLINDDIIIYDTTIYQHLSTFTSYKL